MTDEEYSKLYKAIGYEESSDDPNALPPEVFSFKINYYYSKSIICCR